MSFLAPLFLLGALAVALPVIFHLARRTARERTVFSSLRFLRPAPPRLTRRNRLEHLLLLLLRGLVIALLAFGFARPFLRQATSLVPPAEPARRLVVVVDTSASMRRGNLWSEARDRLEGVLRGTAATDQVAVWTFDRQPVPVVTFEQWTGAAVGDRVGVAQNRLAAVTPGWSSTALDLALVRAAELLADLDDPATAVRRQIVLISDFQSGARLDALQGYEWPKNLEVTLERLSPRVTGTSNAGLQLAPEAPEAALSTELTVRLRVNNAVDSVREQLQVSWARGPNTPVGTNLSVYVPAGQGRVVSLPVPPPGAGADRIVLRGDDEDFDNALFVVPPIPARLTVAYLGSEPATDARQPRYFLERAFRETRRHVVRIAGTEPAGGGASPVLGGGETALVVVTDAVSEAGLTQVSEHLAQGRTVLFAPRDTAAVAALARLPELTGLAAEEGRFANYGLWGEIEFGHPLFAPFADPRFSDFTKTHFWKYRRLDVTAIAGARLLARFDNGDPALVELPAGKGRVLVLASGWHPDDSQLALSSKFVPLLYSVLELSGAGQPAPVSYRVDDPVPLTRDPTRSAAVLTVAGPGGATSSVAAGETQFTETRLPGVYRIDGGAAPAVFAVNLDDGGAAPAVFAVNLDPAESRTTPMPADELERLGVPMTRPARDAVQVAARTARLRDPEFESRQKLWRWAIAATLAILIAETWLAAWTARRAPATAGALP